MNSAGFLKRVLALIYDSLLIAAIIIVASLLLVFINGEYPKPGTLLSVIQFLISILVGPLFYSYFWLTNDGQTTGMQAWKIKLVSSNESKLNMKQTYLRCLISVISFLFIGIGYFWILFNKNNLSWSDIATKTRVIKTD
ncbi:MAG: RDD family protein [Gammaproteobacteria bacterium]|nr:MAG: RDD family protein [Gammaproteobacteria bacterium]